VSCRRLIVYIWLRGVAVNVSSDLRSYSTPGRVSTWMGDRLRAGKPFKCVTSRLGQLSLPFFWLR